MSLEGGAMGREEETNIESRRRQHCAGRRLFSFPEDTASGKKPLTVNNRRGK